MDNFLGIEEPKCSRCIGRNEAESVKSFRLPARFVGVRVQTKPTNPKKINSL